ncbi:helix-turn-helix domain-containing protein [Christiangramia fulva]|nr:XRE family transcriptional regulator [Christiangramia fulva]
MKSINVERIKLARESRGYSQSALAKNLNSISQSMLSKIEKGFADCSAETLSEFSNVLNYPESFFLKKHQAYQIKEFYYRKNLSTTVTKNKILEAKINIISSHISELLDSVEIDVDLPYTNINKLELTPERFAEQVRGYFKIPKGPIKNLINCLEKRGVIIHFVDFDETYKFSGINFHTKEGVPVILINSNHSNSRKIFTIAHELGHLLMHENFIVSDNMKSIEEEANSFASNFLMPRGDIKPDLYNLTESKLGSLKRYWKVSMQALLYRAKYLGCLSAPQYRRWITKINYHGWRKKEPFEFLIEEPELLSKVLLLHFEDLQYEKNEIFEMLAISESEFKEIYSLDKIAKYTGERVRKIKVSI